MLPVLVIELPVIITWNPGDTSRCRCVCRFFHNSSGTCHNKADPARQVRIVTPREFAQDPVEVCAPCYERITGCGPARTEGTALPMSVWQETPAVTVGVR